MKNDNKILNSLLFGAIIMNNFLWFARIWHKLDQNQAVTNETISELYNFYCKYPFIKES